MVNNFAREHILEFLFEAEVTKVYSAGTGNAKINYIDVKDAYGEKFEKVDLLSPFAGKGWGTVFVPPVGQRVLILRPNPNSQRAYCAGCLFDANNPSPYQTDNANEKTYFKYGDGWDITIDSKKKNEKLTVKMGTNDEFSIDQQNQKFSLKSSDGQKLIESDYKNGKIAIKMNQEVTITVGNNSIKISSSGIEIKGAKIDINANGQLTAKASGMVEVSSNATATFKGSASTMLG